MFNKTIAGRRRTLLLNVKPARMSVKRIDVFILRLASSYRFLAGCSLATHSSKYELIAREEMERGGAKTDDMFRVGGGGGDGEFFKMVQLKEQQKL